MRVLAVTVSTVKGVRHLIVCPGNIVLSVLKLVGTYVVSIRTGHPGSGMNIIVYGSSLFSTITGVIGKFIRFSNVICSVFVSLHQRAVRAEDLSSCVDVAPLTGICSNLATDSLCIFEAGKAPVTVSTIIHQHFTVAILSATVIGYPMTDDAVELVADLFNWRYNITLGCYRHCIRSRCHVADSTTCVFGILSIKCANPLPSPIGPNEATRQSSVAVSFPVYTLNRLIGKHIIDTLHLAHQLIVDRI